MPGLKFKQLPNSPYAVVQSQFNDVKYLLGKQFQQDQTALQSQYLTDRQYQAKDAELNAHYNNLLNAQSVGFKSRIGELNRIKSMVGKGQMDPQAGYQAGWKMVLPHETYSARFPKQARVTDVRPMSSAALKSADALMSEFILGAEEKRGWEWGDPYRTKAGMVEQYVNWRAQVGYDALDTMHQNQLDLRWDALMRSDKKFRDWFSDKSKKKPVAEVVSLRSRGRLGRAAFKKLLPDSSRQIKVTPIGKAIQDIVIDGSRGKKSFTQQLPKQQDAPTAEELRRKHTQESYNQGIKLGYWR